MSQLTFDEILKALAGLPMRKTIAVEVKTRTYTRVDVITDHCRFSISADLPTRDDESPYLGCIATHIESGKGNDLPDGALDPGVLDEIVWEIVCYDASFSGAAVPSNGWNRWGTT